VSIKIIFIVDIKPFKELFVSLKYLFERIKKKGFAKPAGTA